MSPRNEAAWILSKGEAVKVGPAEIPVPAEGEIVTENRAVPLHPGDWKLAKGIIPIPLQYPTILGNYVAGTVHSVGPGVTRFKKGDRVLSITALSLKNDHRFGGHQRYSLAESALTSRIGDTPFEDAAHAASIYASMSAMVLHLGLEKPSKHAIPKNESVLIWGGSSSIGFYAIQIAAQAGYRVITTASPRNAEFVKQAGATEVLDYHSPTIYQDLLALGPFRATFGASETAADQDVIGKLLQAQGGGKFLTTMGVRPGVVLPNGVEGFFVQYMDDYFKPEYTDFTRWLFWEWQEEGLVNGTLNLGQVEIVGGLSKTGEALGKLERGEVKGKKLVIAPHVE